VSLHRTDTADAWYDVVGQPGGGTKVFAKFADAVRAHEDTLRAMAFRLCRNSADAEDLVQDTLERAMQHFRMLAPESNVRGWLLSILQHRFIDVCRHRLRRHETSLAGIDAAEQAQEEPPPWAELGPDDVRKAVDRLPDELRTTYELRVHDGLSYGEIAFSLGLSVGTVKSRLTRARQALRAELGALRC